LKGQQANEILGLVKKMLTASWLSDIHRLTFKEKYFTENLRVSSRQKHLKKNILQKVFLVADR
jgi:hypothetical protein